MCDRLQKAADAVKAVCQTMATLRAPGGCPWDAKQTLASLKPYLIEEAFETIDAMDGGEPKKHCEELGDVLLQVIFQAEIAQETSTFDLADVASALDAKLKRRHPDVFAPCAADRLSRPTHADDALKRWERIKATERPRHEGRLSGVPKAMPALLRALRTSEKAASAGFDWPSTAGCLDKVAKKLGDLREAVDKQAQSAHKEDIHAAMGDVFFALVNVSRRLEIDPEAALRNTIEGFARRFAHIEQRINERGQRFETTSLDTMQLWWQEAKLAEQTQ